MKTFIRRKKRGFTLIELMITIVIIGLLAAIMLPNFMRARFRALHSACMQHTRNIATALELYTVETGGFYPPDLATLTAPLSSGGKPFINAIPTCPSNGVTYDGPGYTPVDDHYTLACPGVHEHQIPGVEDGFPMAVDGELRSTDPNG